jgi:hypothetical protein
MILTTDPDYKSPDHPITRSPELFSADGSRLQKARKHRR